MDKSKIIESFIAESLEKVHELETGLLALEKDPSAPSLIDQLFRAAHTIKGTSGSLELFDISEFTHLMEEVLERVRVGDLQPSRDIVNLLLDSTDILRSMVESLAQGTEPDTSRQDEVIKSLKEAERSAAGNEFEIVFSHDPALFNTDKDPSSIVEDLRRIGEVLSVDTEVAAPPEGGDETGIAMRWKIRLRTGEEASAVRSVFDPLGSEGTLSVTPLKRPPGKEASRLGEILVEEGTVSSEEVNEALKSQKKLGDILVDQGKVGEDEVERALKEQKYRRLDSIRNLVSSTIRVDLGKLDGLVNLVGEMAIMHSIIQQRLLEAGGEDSREVEGLFSQLVGIGKDIQEGVMSLRMLPVGEIFNRFTRLVRELSTSTGKSVELLIEGEDTELDKSVIEKITDPLVHLIRNCIDHGIETIDERIALNKTLQGTLRLKAYQAGDAVHIEVSDDGRGLDSEKILKRAREMGLLHDSQNMTEEEILGLIFHPGLSTASSVTGISGRGVGMDVVKSNIEQLSGRISVRSELGAGTAVTMKLPLTLAIIEGLIFTVADEVFIVPVVSVLESFRPSRGDVHGFVEKDEMIHLRGEFIPLVRLRRFFGLGGGGPDPWEGIVVLVSHEGRRCCLLVDELVGQQQVVIKKFGGAMPKVPWIAGGTILGDGGVALVIDIAAVAEETMAAATAGRIP